jgi:hypothetical protein
VLPGFWLRLDWLWMQDPDPLMALCEIVGLERMLTALHQPG